MYRVLCSNVESVKERAKDKSLKVETKTHEIGIAVLDEVVRENKSTPTFYAYRSGRLYDPADEFKPQTKGDHKLDKTLIGEYWDLLPTAKYYYKNILEIEGGTPKKDDPEKDREKENERMQALKQKEAELEAQSKLIAEQAKMIEDMRKNTVKQPIRHPKFDGINEILDEGVAVYLHGPAGTGKSHMAEQVAKYRGLDFYPASTVTQEFKLTGYEDAGGLYHDTNFYKAITKGGLFFLDEMDSCSAEVLVGLNGALANGYFDFPHETVKKHKDFRVLSAGNTIGHGAVDGYEGRQPLDISTLDRFMAMRIEYSPEIDLEVAKGDRDLVEFAHAIREGVKKTGITLLASYRCIDYIVKFKGKFDLSELLEMALIKGMNAENMRMLSRNMEIKSSNEYYKAFQNAIAY